MRPVLSDKVEAVLLAELSVTVPVDLIKGNRILIITGGNRDFQNEPHILLVSAYLPQGALNVLHIADSVAQPRQRRLIVLRQRLL